MDTAKYAYEIQVAGKNAVGGLACTKFAASYRKTLDVKDVGVEIGITSPAALEAKTRISGHAKFVEVFGGFHNRIGSPVFMQVHLRVAVYQAGQPGQLVYTTGWYGAPSGDILHWPWPADCAWVQEQKGEGNQVVKAAEKAGGASASVGSRMAKASGARMPGDIHRIGGGTVENLRLKPEEAALEPPGISVLKAPTPGEAAAQIRAAFPKATGLDVAARTVGSTTEAAIRGAGFDIIANRTRKLPNHYRIIHPEGASGFTDENLARLAGVFTNTTGY